MGATLNGVSRSSGLLRLHYDDLISADQFGEEQAKLTLQIETLRDEIGRSVAESVRSNEVAEQFEKVAAVLRQLDLDRIWQFATEQERRTLLDELLDSVAVHPDHLEVAIHGAPRLNVQLSEVGLKDSQKSGVGGGT